MNRTETIRLLAMLKTEFPREQIDANRTEIWTAALAKYDLGAALAAVGEHMADPEKGSYFPHPADVIRHIQAAAPLTGPAPAIARLEAPDADPIDYIRNRWDDKTETYQRLAEPVPFDRRDRNSYAAALEHAGRVSFRQPKRRPRTQITQRR